MISGALILGANSAFIVSVLQIGDTMFIQTEATPNPATLKFLPGRSVSEAGTVNFENREQAGKSPLAEKLFSINGVSGVMYGVDFISVTKADGEWQHIKPVVLGALMEHFMSGAILMVNEAVSSDVDNECFEPADASIVSTIKDLLESRVRPTVAADGGDITFRGYRNGIVFLEMKGACAGCPSSNATLKHGVENLLRHYVPEIQSVEQI